MSGKTPDPILSLHGSDSAGSHVASGVYFVRLAAGSAEVSQKLIVK